MSERIQFGQLAAALLRVPVPWVFVLTYLAGVGMEAAFHRGGFFRATAPGSDTRKRNARRPGSRERGQPP